MKSRILAIGASVMIAASFAVPAMAQVGNSTQTRRNTTQQRPAPKNYNSDLRDLTVDIGKRLHIRIVVDPGIFVAAKPVPPDPSLTINQVMTGFTTTYKSTAWRKVYMTSNAATTMPAADKLCSSVRALDQLEQSGLVLEDTATKRATSYLKNFPAGPSMKDDLAAQGFSGDPVYVLYSALPGDASLPIEQRYANLSKQSLDMMMQMSPDQLQGAMQQSMQMFMNLDPQTRSTMMGNMMQMGMRMFQNMSPDQRQELMNSVMQNIGNMGGGAGGAGAR